MLESLSNETDYESERKLQQFESTWLEGTFPNLADFLVIPHVRNPRFISDLIEIDLEYRWKRFRLEDPAEYLGENRFPEFPRIEDYARIFENQSGIQLITPHLMAEEYRVRSLWGDCPEKQEYLDRLPNETSAMLLALDEVDVDLEIEGLTPLDDVTSSKNIHETTILFSEKSSSNKAKPKGYQIPTQVENYQIETLIGRGGFGEVWKAFDRTLKRHVAIKFPRQDKHYSQEILDHFHKEAQKVAELETVAGVVPVYYSGTHAGIPFIVSYLVNGEDLGERVLAPPQLSTDEITRIVAEVAETLHQAHLKSLFHRDVKLSNILLDQKGRAYLSDFGLCVSEGEQLDEGHAAVGSYAYMSPEQIYGNSHRIDGRSDIYSLGVVLYRLLTGRLPYLAKRPVDYMDQVLHRQPRPPRSLDDQIPTELERICLKCLDKEISKRYSTAGDLARELRQTQSTIPTRSTKYWGQLAAGVIAFIGLLIVIGLTWNPNQPESSNQTRPADLEHHVPVQETSILSRNDFTELVFDHRRVENNWHYEPKAGRLYLETQDDALISAGLHAVENRVIQARFMSEGSLWGGVFWNFRESDQIEGPRRFSCYAASFRVNHELLPDAAKLLRLHFEKQADGNLRLTIVEDLREISIQKPERSAQLIEIDFINSRVKYDRQRLDLFSRHPEATWQNADGQLGILIRQGNVSLDLFRLVSQ